jgi:hypothetical protein
VAARSNISAHHVLTSATRRRTSTLATSIAHSRLGQTVAEPIEHTRSFASRSYGWIFLSLRRWPLHSRYWRSAADARGSAATDASVRLRRLVSQRPRSRARDTRGQSVPAADPADALCVVGDQFPEASRR